MADLFETEDDVPGAGAAGDRPEAVSGELPAGALPPAAAPKPELDVAAGVPRKIVHPEYEPKEISENRPLSGEPPAPAGPIAGSLTDNERKVLLFKTEHPDATQPQIAKAAGLALGTVNNILHRPHVQMYLSTALNMAGSTIEKNAKVIAEAQEAVKETPIIFNGEITDVHSQPDHDTRLKAAKLSLEGHGALDQKVSVSVYHELTDEQLAQVAAGMKRVDDFIDLSPK